MASGTSRLVYSDLVSKGKSGQVTKELSKNYDATARKIKKLPNPSAKK